MAGERLLDEARRLAARISANPGRTLRLTKRLLHEAQSAQLEETLELSAGFQVMAHKTRQHREAVLAFIEKRPLKFSDE